MHISLITLSTPTYNNVRAASALPYHLIMGAKEQGNIDFEVYSYNINAIDAVGIAETERALGVKIHLLQKPWWMLWMFRLHLGILRVLLKYPYLSYLRVPEEAIKKIKSSNPDIIWIYGEEIAGIAKAFEGIKRIVTMPDCESMFYYRMLRLRWATKHLSQILRYAFAYWQYRSMERHNCRADVIYHFVGEADAEFSKNRNKRLKTAGFVSSHIKFAPDYIEELQKHDIQINAIDVGTGTKGKVLDAISNGLLAFGTNYALENVAVRNGESCVQYSTVEEAMDRLVDICAHRNEYEQMAETGRRLVLQEHDRGKIADKIFDITKVK